MANLSIYKATPKGIDALTDDLCLASVLQILPLTIRARRFGKGTNISYIAVVWEDKHVRRS